MYNKVVLVTSCLEEALKEKEKPKEEEKEKPKDAAGLECKPRPLHKTCSLFMRNIAPNISRAEIISVSGDIGLRGRVGVNPRSFRWQTAFGIRRPGPCGSPPFEAWLSVHCLCWVLAFSSWEIKGTCLGF
jgi:hypothetical protein